MLQTPFKNGRLEVERKAEALEKNVAMNQKEDLPNSISFKVFHQIIANF